jgi:LacI family transcriptional regulator
MTNLKNHEIDQGDTLDQIAAEAGVSKRTVHRILEGANKEIWPSAIRRGEQIRGIATRLGYRPNTAARAVATGQFHAVGLILSSEAHRSSLPDALLRGICSTLAEHSFHLMVSVMPDERLTSDRFIPKMLQEESCDGILLNYHAHVPPHLDELLERYRVPVIWTNAKREWDSVYPDDFKAGRDATQLLLDAGHRRIAYLDVSYQEAVDSGTLHYSKTDRLSGYKFAMEKAGLMPETVLPPLNAMVSSLEQLLARPDRPTALVSYAWEASERLVVERMGLRIPETLSIVGFGGGLLRRNDFPTTRMVIPDWALARTAVEMLIQKIRAPDRRIKSKCIAFEAPVGESVAPPLPDSASRPS